MKVACGPPIGWPAQKFPTDLNIDRLSVVAPGMGRPRNNIVQVSAASGPFA